MSDKITELQKRIDYQFKDISWLKEALTHSSKGTRNKNYERLEFLGDRVLSLAVADLLITHFPQETEGDLAKRHTALVQQNCLAEIAQQLELGDYILLSTSEDLTGGRQKAAILADVVEAIIGAIYKDGGYHHAAIFIQQTVTPLMERYQTPPTDPKTQLQEWAQARQQPLPAYIEKSVKGPSHAPIFEITVTVEGLGSATAAGASKKIAEKEAATLLLKKAGEIS